MVRAIHAADEFEVYDGPVADLSDLGEVAPEAAAAASVKQAEYFEESGPSPPLPAGESSQGQDTTHGQPVEPADDLEEAALGGEATDLFDHAGEEATDV